MINKRIVVATGNNQIDDLVKKHTGYNIVGVSRYTDGLENAINESNAEILLVTEVLNGDEDVFSSLLKLKTQNPNLRIIFVVGKLDLRNQRDVDELALLVMSGIYDIVIEPKISIDMLKRAIDNEKTEEDVRYILNASNSKKKSRKEDIEFVVPKELKEDEDLRGNLYAVSSVKPGTGKSFVSVNVAAAIAEFGVPNKEGKPPKVGLIEADLQNLSIGTLLQIEDKDRNIKKAMEKVAEIVDEAGRLHGTPKEIEEVNEYIKNSFVPYKGNQNLLAFAGSQIIFEELKNINRFHYIYLIEAVIDDFDILIIDTNSSLTHTTTFPVLQMAQACYYVLNLDYNNVRNNARYRDTLDRIGLADKVKYVLNEDISPEAVKKENGESLLFNSEDLEDAGFKLEAKIPVIPKSVFLNRLYEGIPISLDRGKNTEKARKEIMTIANQIYPLKGFSK